MRQKLLLVIGGGLIAAAVALGAVVAIAGGGLGSVGGVPGGMMGSFGSRGMMGSFGTTASQSGKAISIDQAQNAVQAVLDRQGNRDLAIDEVIEFQDNVYASIRESTGIGAYELLVNRSTGAVNPEPGPNMMWNTRYGMMAGWGVSMMGGRGMMGVGTATGSMTISADQATQAAQRWLDQNQPGSTTETPNGFHGYYSVHLRRDGVVTGMLSVNGYTGQVWYHTWHGSFIQERDLGA
jgi:hypothetical protein